MNSQNRIQNSRWPEVGSEGDQRCGEDLQAKREQRIAAGLPSVEEFSAYSLVPMWSQACIELHISLVITVR